MEWVKDTVFLEGILDIEKMQELQSKLLKKETPIS